MKVELDVYAKLARWLVPSAVMESMYISVCGGARMAETMT